MEIWCEELKPFVLISPNIFLSLILETAEDSDGTANVAIHASSHTDPSTRSIRFPTDK